VCTRLRSSVCNLLGRVAVGHRPVGIPWVLGVNLHVETHMRNTSVKTQTFASGDKPPSFPSLQIIAHLYIYANCNTHFVLFRVSANNLDVAPLVAMPNI
jgi:hypothetical protein